MYSRKSREELERELQELRDRLEVAEETLQAITQGEVDALVVSKAEGEQIYTLQGADYPYRLFVEQMKEGAATLSDEGMILYCNRRLASLLKQPLEQVIGSAFKHYIPEQQQQRWQVLLQNAQAGVEKYELVLVASDNTQIVVHVSLSSLTMDDVNLICLIATDLTEQKRYEAVLSQMAAIVESSEDGILSVSLDGIILSWNAGAQKLFGYTSEDVIGRPISILIPPEGQDKMHHILEKIKRGESIEHYETVRVCKDGRRIDISTMVSPMKDKNGTIIGASAIKRDISAQKRTREELRLSKERLQLALEASGDGLWDWNITTSEIYLSPEWVRMLGYEEDERPKVLSAWEGLIHPDDKPWVLERLKAHVKDSSIPYHFDYRMRTKSGEWKWIENYGKVVVRDEKGLPVRMTGTHKDISDRKQAETQIKASLKEKEVLLQEIHHRVKNNLQIVDSLLQLQSRRTRNQQVVDILLDSQNRISSIALVHEKLYRSEDLANINFAQYIPDLTVHLFDSYNIDSTAVTLHMNVENIALEIDTAIPCGLIINELVSNALKYAFPDNRNGEIQIEFHVDPERMMTLIVRDDGIGIPEGFDIEMSQSLGLTLVQGLVEQLEGTLELERTRGTEFRITFPGGRT